MKNLVAKAGVAAAGSMMLLTTAGVKSANALFIEAKETFSVSQDVNIGLNTGPDPRQFRSYDPVLNPDGSLGGLFNTGRYHINDSDIDALRAYQGDPLDPSVPDNRGGDVTDMAIVGSFTSEEIRGLVEFDLSIYESTFKKLDDELAEFAADPANTPEDIAKFAQEKADIKAKLIASAVMNFEVFQLGGLHPDNQFPLNFGIDEFFAGNVEVLFYQGNGLEEVSDYDTPVILDGSGNNLANLGLFTTAGLQKGSKVSFSISSAVAYALDNGWKTLGIQLQAQAASSPITPLGHCMSPGCGAITFHKFTIGAVPTPAAILPTLFGMGMAAIRKRKNTETEEAEA